MYIVVELIWRSELVENGGNRGSWNQGYFASAEKAVELKKQLEKDYPECEFIVKYEEDSEYPEL
jgi:hypothetical protein